MFILPHPGIRRASTKNKNSVFEEIALVNCYTGNIQRDSGDVLFDRGHKFLECILFEKDPRVGKEDVENSMTDFHRRRQDDRNVF